MEDLVQELDQTINLVIGVVREFAELFEIHCFEEGAWNLQQNKFGFGHDM